MKKEDDSTERILSELMELHERVTEVEKLEIERKKAENMVRGIEEKLHELFKETEQVITIVQDRLIKYVNPSVEELIGYTPEELIGTLFAKHIHPDELPRLAKNYLQRLAGEDIPNVYKSILKHKNGSDVHVEIKGCAIHWEGKIADFGIARKIDKLNNE